MTHPGGGVFRLRAYLPAFPSRFLRDSGMVGFRSHHGRGTAWDFHPSSATPPGPRIAPVEVYIKFDFFHGLSCKYTMFPLKVFGRCEGKRGKVLVFGKKKRSVQYPKYLFKAFCRKGFSVYWVYLPERWQRGLRGCLGWYLFKRFVSSYGPDFVLFRSIPGGKNILNSLGSMGVLRVAFYPIITDKLGYSKTILDISQGFDHFFVSWRDTDLFRASGGRIKFLMQGVDPEEHRPYDGVIPEFVSQISFIGKPHSKERVEFLKRVFEVFDVKVYGGNWSDYGIGETKRKVDPLEFSRIVSSSKVSLGYDIGHERSMGFSIRLWLTLGCRGFYLTNYVKDMEELFRNHHHLVWYRDWDEFVELAKFYLERGSERERIARCGYEFALKNRTYDHVVDDMLKEIGYS